MPDDGGTADDARAANAPGGRRRRARRGEGERLREEIVAAASAVLEETGQVGELSLRAVAREVGVATTSIYLHFERIEELVRAVKERYFEEFGDELETAARAAGAVPAARVRAAAHRYVEYGLRSRGKYWVMFSSEQLPSSMMPPGGYLGARAFESVRAEVAAALGPDADAQLRAIHLWTALHGIVMLRTTRPHFPWPDLDRQVDDFLDLLLP